MPTPSFYHQEKLQRLSDNYLKVFIEKLEKKLNKPIEEIVADEDEAPCGEPENMVFMTEVPVIDSPIFDVSYKANKWDLDKWCNTICKHLSDSPSSKIMFICAPEFSPFLSVFSNNKGVCLLSSYGVRLGDNNFFLDMRISFMVIDKPTEEAGND